MKKGVLMPVLAAIVFTTACGDDGGPTTVDTRVSVRFVNMTTGIAGSGGFTANGKFVAGSALASGQVAQVCSKLDGGQTSFGFGASNAAGTGLSGNELVTLLNENISAGGDYPRGSWTRNEPDAAPAQQRLLGVAGDEPVGSSLHESRPDDGHDCV